VYDVVVKSSRSLSHLLMSFLYIYTHYASKYVLGLNMQFPDEEIKHFTPDSTPLVLETSKWDCIYECGPCSENSIYA